MLIVERSNWTTKPMPRLRSKIVCHRSYPDGEMEQMMRGVLPRQMEDKWFIFWEPNTLHFHRSWTGACVFRVKFPQLKSGWKLYEIAANRNQEQYSSSDEYDSKHVPFLIDVVLLHKKVVTEDESPETAVELWHQIGRATVGEHPGTGRRT